MRIKNHNRIIVANLNINSIRNKFDALKTIIPGNIDIFVITETKLDASFETTEFTNQNVWKIKQVLKNNEIIVTDCIKRKKESSLITSI